LSGAAAEVLDAGAMQGSKGTAYLRNVIRIITETGLRVYKELASMKKEQVDLANKVVFIVDSKTPGGVAEAPLTDIALEAFRSQMELAGPGPWLFPSDGNKTGHRQNSKRLGEPHSGRPAFRISGFTTFARLMLRG
jgi:integrase